MPTTRGDVTGSSPLARGKPGHRGGRGRPLRIIPACAGETRRPRAASTRTPDHPRLRGGNAAVGGGVGGDDGSSPLARGKPKTGWFGGVEYRIIPACAGETASAEYRILPYGDHPRLRGGNSTAMRYMRSAPGSSPLARGKLVTKRGFHVPERIIPACAGETPQSTPHRYRIGDHPRLSGGNDSIHSASLPDRGSSPLARGKRLAGRGRGQGRRIIPACAGETLGDPQ